MSLKVMTIVGTRPEIIKLSRVMSELEKHTKHILVHTGQNYDYELNEVFFKDLEIRKPDHFLSAVGKTTAETIGNIITESDKIMEKVNPDAVLLYGDTNSCLSVISAKRRQIPIFHMEAGNRCFDQRVPEEINRKIVDHLSDINMPLTEHARQYLINEGLPAEKTIKTGSCMKEVLGFYGDKIGQSDILKKLSLQDRKYFIVSAHREENVDYPQNLNNLIESLNALASEYNHPIIFSTHPRTKKRLEAFGQKNVHKNIQFLKPLGFFDYVKLQMHATCVLSDSGTLTEESSVLKFPGVMLRAAHERPEGMDEGTVVMSSLNPERVRSAVHLVTNHFKDNPEIIRIVEDYNVNNVSKKVVRIILSYVDYINRTVWHKDSIQRFDVTTTLNDTV